MKHVWGELKHALLVRWSVLLTKKLTLKVSFCQFLSVFVSFCSISGQIWSVFLVSLLTFLVSFSVAKATLETALFVCLSVRHAILKVL